MKADFLDSTLYVDEEGSTLPQFSRGSLLVALSRAFDLAEGRRPGHAQRVAYIGVSLADELGLDQARMEAVFFACLLHDVGMAGSDSMERERLRQLRNMVDGKGSPPTGPEGRPDWKQFVEALGGHCVAGAQVARKLGFGETVARAVAGHHECWDSVAANGKAARVPLVARIVAAADRTESLIDSEASPLVVRRRGPELVRGMSGAEIEPKIAEMLSRIATRDSFWLGLYDNDLGGQLMDMGFGGELNHEEVVDFLAVVSDVIDSRGGRQPGRGRRIAELAHRVAHEAQLPAGSAELVRIAALLQDIGTLGVPAAYLAKPDILTIDEMAAVQMHPTYARDILSEIPGLSSAAWWVGCHHERIDGKGYPAMLEGEEVPFEAQIIGICEAYEALISERPYRSALSPDDAMEVIGGMAGTRFESALLPVFERALTADSAAA